MRQNDKTGKAFTLVELLVVISILALLLSILMPSLNKAKQAARRTMCASNLHSIYMAFSVYQSNFNSWPISVWSNTDSFATTAWWEPLVWTGIFRGKETVKGNNEWIVDSSESKAQICPSFKDWASRRSIGYGAQYGMGYAYNDHLSPFALAANGTFVRNDGFVGKMYSKNLVMLIDASGFFIAHNEWCKPWSDILRKQPWKANGTIGVLHSEGANSAWTDGHVEYRKAKDYKPEMFDGKIEPIVR